jgi:hypothetical protein
VYLLRVLLAPSEKMPRVLLPAADPPEDAALDAVAVPFVSQAYVYLSRIVLVPAVPSAKMPRVLLPAADPPNPATLDDVAAPLVSVA